MAKKMGSEFVNSIPLVGDPSSCVVRGVVLIQWSRTMVMSIPILPRGMRPLRKLTIHVLKRNLSNLGRIVAVASTVDRYRYENGRRYHEFSISSPPIATARDHNLTILQGMAHIGLQTMTSLQLTRKLCMCAINPRQI